MLVIGRRLAHQIPDALMLMQVVCTLQHANRNGPGAAETRRRCMPFGHGPIGHRRSNEWNERVLQPPKPFILPCLSFTTASIPVPTVEDCELYDSQWHRRGTPSITRARSYSHYAPAYMPTQGTQALEYRRFPTWFTPESGKSGTNEPPTDDEPQLA
ncbi:hypothetical protein BDP81DRAFT_53727 [Colletotrichum phormii]|uniref:Uncharacterized protein n=1 Tax=Colletotrichum phormii TaxID=359342 RepID=A0AAI9ZMQ8_9PEZI|nr:uncharacterized protein BDP81DRAFT_53727 [Colletotrichum phormii]KAK1634846.1 hypothetical protein BDP81DRAFT_53727 [Colletotrichum phormii]